MWNELPAKLKCLKSVNLTKRELNYIFNTAIYDLPKLPLLNYVTI